MTLHRESKILPYSAACLFALVKDVGRYHEFLPWLTHSRVYNVEEGNFLADLTIGYKIVREGYTSRVTYAENAWLKAECIKGPFRHLRTVWTFEQVSDETCRVDFSLDYQFSNFIFDKLLSGVFGEVARTIMTSFEKRASDFH